MDDFGPPPVVDPNMQQPPPQQQQPNLMEQLLQQVMTQNNSLNEQNKLLFERLGNSKARLLAAESNAGQATGGKGAGKGFAGVGSSMDIKTLAQLG